MSSKFTIGINHGLKTGEKVILLSDAADYPENIDSTHTILCNVAFDTAPNLDKIQLAPTKVDAENGNNSLLFMVELSLRILIKSY